MSEKKEQGLITQQKALTQYLDSLLMEIPEEYEVVDTPQRPRREVESPGERKAATIVDEVAPKPFQKIPDWGSKPFKVLFFSVDEITLAAPLERLGAVLTEFGEIKTMPGAADYYYGVLINRGETIRVIDFSRFIAVTEGGSSGLEQSEIGVPDRVIVIEGSGIGIACHNLTEVVEIVPEEVRWRSGVSRRPWYRGILRERMCALLDIGALVSILNENESK